MLSTLEKENDNYESGDEDEPITAQKVLENLEIAWTNEHFAPEILCHRTEMVELMLGQIAHIEENMKDIDKNDFRFIAHQMELERIRFIIASYLRSRLNKIETYTKHIIMEEDLRDETEKRLSGEEKMYAIEFHENVEKYFNIVALQFVPNLQRSDSEKRVVRPNLMSHVFLKADVSVVQPGSGSTKWLFSVDVDGVAKLSSSSSMSISVPELSSSVEVSS